MYRCMGLDTRADIEWWAHYAGTWNGISMMQAGGRAISAAIVTSDASGNWAVEHARVVTGSCSNGQVQSQVITLLLQCDNMAVVNIINHSSSKNQDALHLVWCLAFITATREFHPMATHIKGTSNILADALSTNNLPLFHSLYHP